MSLAAILQGDPVDVAPLLLGARLMSQVGEVETTVLINEVEAYREDDPASHSFRGRSTRNRTMFGPSGKLYVYRSYGVHWCANVVTGPPGWGAAVLLRGGIPVRGLATMISRRGRTDHLTDGPGKLTAALGISGVHDGCDLETGEIRLILGPPVAGYRTTPRIGISQAVDRPWRFVVGPEWLKG